MDAALALSVEAFGGHFLRVTSQKITPTILWAEQISTI